MKSSTGVISCRRRTGPGTCRALRGGRTFGVPPSIFFGDYDEQQAGLLQEQIEMLAMIRDAGITSVQLRAFVGMPPEAREAFVELIKYTARDEAERAKGSR